MESFQTKDTAEEEETPSRCNTKRMNKFMENSSFSTFMYVFQSRSWTKRVFWLGVVIAAIAAFIYTTVNSFIMLYSEPTATTISLERETELMFPAVTLCSISLLNTSRLTSAGENVTNDLIRLFDHATPSGSQTCKAIARQIATDVQRDPSWGQLTTDARNPASSIITSCTFGGKPCSPTADFEPISTVGGVCYTFNASLPVSGTGVRRGLRLQLKRDDQTFSLNNDQGYRVIIHNPNEPPRPSAEGIAIAQDSTVYIGMTEVRTVDDTQYSTLRCRDDSEGYSGNLTFPHSPPFPYSRSICETDCFFNHVAEQCGCVEHLFYSTPGKFNTTRDCKLEDLCCEVQEFDAVNEMCNCVPQCSFVDRALTVSSSTHDSSASAVNIYFESLVVETRTTTDSYTPFSLISDIGGNSGLFLGFTLLTMAELLMWIVGEIRDRLFFCVPKMGLAKKTKQEV